jgi:hypothetical protein
MHLSSPKTTRKNYALDSYSTHLGLKICFPQNVMSSDVMFPIKTAELRVQSTDFRQVHIHYSLVAYPNLYP